MEVKIIFLCFFGFVAQFVDSIAGGGGLISIPALLAFGIPPHYALGTNKLGAIFGTMSSSIKFIQSKNVHFSILKYMIPAVIVGAILGVNTVLIIDQKILNILVCILLFVVCLYTIFKKDLGSTNTFNGVTRKNIFIGIIIALVIGFYDGFFGPGSGSFLIFFLISGLGFDFLSSCGNAKVLNSISVIAGFIVFALHQKVIYSIGIPMGISMMLGALLGTKLAISNGKKLIKPIFIIIAICFMAKLSYQSFF